MPRIERQPLLLVPPTDTVRITEDWHVAKDGDKVARALYCRHYSSYEYRDGRDPKQFIGPGEHLVLVSGCGHAAFAWRFHIDDFLGRKSLWCAFFRNEGHLLSSDLVKQARRVAECRWPGEPQYTTVSPAVQSANPGYCFKLAGFKFIGRTKRGLHVLEATA